MWTFNKHSPNFVPWLDFFFPLSHKPLVKQRGIMAFPSYCLGSLGRSSHGKKISSDLPKSPAWLGLLPCWQGGKALTKPFSLRRCTVPSFTFAGCSSTPGKHQRGDFRINSHNTSAVTTSRSAPGPVQVKPHEGFPLILKEHWTEIPNKCSPLARHLPFLCSRY